MPFVIRFAHHQNWLATPDERRMHPVPTPDVGGIAMFIGVLVAVVAASLINDFDSLFQDSTEIVGVVVACAIIFVLGLLDDIRDRLALQSERVRNAQEYARLLDPATTD